MDGEIEMRIKNNDPTVKCLRVVNNTIAADVLADTLEDNTHLRSLFLEDNTFNADEYETILDALAPPTGVTNLDLSNTAIDIHSIRHIAEFLEKNNTVTKLDLSNNPHITADGVQILCAALTKNTTVQHLDLSSLNMGDEGFSHVLEVIPKLQHLRKLYINRNKIPLHGVDKLIQVLNDADPAITHLQLWSNEVSKEHNITLQLILQRNRQEVEQARQAAELQAQREAEIRALLARPRSNTVTAESPRLEGYVKEGSSAPGSENASFNRNRSSSVGAVPTSPFAKPGEEKDFKPEPDASQDPANQENGSKEQQEDGEVVAAAQPQEGTQELGSTKRQSSEVPESPHPAHVRHPLTGSIIRRFLDEPPPAPEEEGEAVKV